MSESLSSLDLFILALIQRGVNTPYAMREQAGLSLGGTRPALKRLEGLGLVLRSDRLNRNRQPFTLSKAGAGALKAGINPLLDIPTERSTGDIESILRIASLAAVSGRQPKAVRLLIDTASRLRKRAGSLTTEKKRDSQVSDLGQTYKNMLRIYEESRLTVQAGTLERLAQTLREDQCSSRGTSRPVRKPSKAFRNRKSTTGQG
jgi:hypothetical protein